MTLIGVLDIDEKIIILLSICFKRCLYVGFTMDQTAVANKIKNLRETYKRELKKVEDSEDTGSSADSVYVPTLAWFEDASFWRPHVLTRQTRDTMVCFPRF